MQLTKNNQEGNTCMVKDWIAGKSMQSEKKKIDEKSNSQNTWVNLQVSQIKCSKAQEQLEHNAKKWLKIQVGSQSLHIRAHTHTHTY